MLTVCPIDNPLAYLAIVYNRKNFEQVVSDTAKPPTLTIGNGGGMSEESCSSQMRKNNEPLFASISSAVKTMPCDEEEQGLLFTDTLQRLRGFFYNGATEKMANQIIDCLVEQGTATAITRKNCALLLSILSCNLKMPVDDKSFTDILMNNTLFNFENNLEYIRTSDFAGGSFDHVMLYVELFVCIMIAGCKLYEAERHFGVQIIAMERIFDKIKLAIIVKENTDRCTRRMLISVVELRAAAWGEVVGPLKNNLPIESDLIVDPIYVKADGDNPHMENFGSDSGLAIPSFITGMSSPEISEDQIKYLLNNNFVQDEEYDEELMEAFEKFSCLD